MDCGHELGAGQMLVGHEACTGHGGRSHDVDVPRLRCDGLRAAAGLALCGAGWACGGADLQPPV